MPVERMHTDQLRHWRADPGWTAITIEVWPHHQAVTVSIEDRELDDMLRSFETETKITEADRTDPGSWASIRGSAMRELVAALARFDRNVIQGCAIVALWCVLNHPNDRGVLRLKMEALRAQGKAPHFTLCRGPSRTFATALGDRYADMRKDVEQRVGPQTTLFGVRDFR